jgi:hypothetical protein
VSACYCISVIFNDEVTWSGCMTTALNARVSSEQWKWAEPNLRSCHGIFVDEMTVIMKICLAWPRLRVPNSEHEVGY